MASRDLQNLQISMPSWVFLLLVAPSQRIASPVDRRSPSPAIATPIRDRNEPVRQLVRRHDLERFRTSYGEAGGSIEVALSRIIGEDDLGTFMTGLESAYEKIC